MAAGTSKTRSTVILTASGRTEQVLEEIRMPVDEYYDRSSELIDSSSYRQSKGVGVVRGKIYDAKGRLVQSFENHYDDDGSLRRNRTVHDDGSVTEQVIKK